VLCATSMKVMNEQNAASFSALGAANFPIILSPCTTGRDSEA
jgi:hypothetical protein